MEPLSAAASIIAVLELSEKVVSYAISVAKAKKERQNIRDALDNLVILVRSLKSRIANSADGEPWYEGLKQMVNLSGSRDANGKFVIDLENGKGPVANISQILKKLEARLRPPAHPHLKKFMWFWERDSIEALLKDFDRLRDNIQAILADDHFELSLELRRAQIEETEQRQQAETERQLRERKRQVEEEAGAAEVRKALQSVQQSQLESEQRLRAERQKQQLSAIASEKQEIAQWLSPLEFLARQEELFDGCFPRTGRWLLDSEVFQQWTLGRPWHLRCYGQAGAGKTILSSIVFDHLEQSVKTENIPILCLYLNYKESKVQTVQNLIGSLLKQLIQLDKTGYISNDLRELYKSAKVKEAKPRLRKVKEILSAELAKYDRVFLVVDAFDETPHQIELMTEFNKLQLRKVSLMVTSRKVDSDLEALIADCDFCDRKDIKIYFHSEKCTGKDICLTCKGISPWRQRPNELYEHRYENDRVELDVYIPDDDLQQDLQQYIIWEMRKELDDYGEEPWSEDEYMSRRGETRLGRKLSNDPELYRRIPSKIVGKATGRLLYTKLYIDSVKAQHTLRDIRETLDGFPKEMDEVYKQALKRIQEQAESIDGDLGRKVLSCVACAHRPLSLAELSHLLAITLGETDHDDEREYDREDVLSCTAGLVTIGGDMKTVRLVHQSLQEYLDRKSDEWFPHAEVDMAQACLTYLNYSSFSEPSSDAEFDTKLAQYPFIAYASQYWGLHVRNASMDNGIREKAVQFMNQPGRIAAYIQAAFATDRGSTLWDVRKGVGPLHVCAWFGLSHLISSLDIEDLALEINAQEPTYGQTPLHYACRAGHFDVVGELLDLGVNVNMISGRGRTALFEAVLQNHFGVVELLLTKRRDLDINAVHAKDYNRTALMLAADRHSPNLDIDDHLNIVERLLGHPDIDVNRQDTHGYTALSLAVLSNATEVVKLLLKSPDIDPNIVSFTPAGQSALMFAARSNNATIVELLLKEGAEANVEDHPGGSTAILRAVDEGAISVVQIMLKYEVDIKHTDEGGRGLVHSASLNGYPDIVRLLIRNGLDPNVCDKNGLTPLHDASRGGKVEVTKTLLDLKADKTVKDKFGRSCWTVAWQYGYTQIMSVLDGGGGSPTEHLAPIPNAEKLPIWSMAKLGLSILIEKAISIGEKDLFEREPGSGNTPLHCAVGSSHPAEVLRLLLRSGLSANDINDTKRSPLHLAAADGITAAAEVLLDNQADLDLRDKWDYTALSLAAAYKYYSLAVTLIDAGAEIDTEKEDIQTLFFAAVRVGNTKVAEILLGRGANKSERNADGLRPIQLAKESNDTEMMMVLRNNPTFSFKPESSTEPAIAESADSTPFVSPQMSHDFVPFRPRPKREMAYAA